MREKSKFQGTDNKLFSFRPAAGCWRYHSWLTSNPVEPNVWVEFENWGRLGFLDGRAVNTEKQNLR